MYGGKLLAEKMSLEVIHLKIRQLIFPLLLLILK